MQIAPLLTAAGGIPTGLFVHLDPDPVLTTLCVAKHLETMNVHGEAWQRLRLQGHGLRRPCQGPILAWASCLGLRKQMHAAVSFSLLSTGQAASSLVLCLPGLAGPTVTCLFELTMSEIKGS